MSTIKANQWLNSDGTENYKCRAWVNITVTGGVPSVNAAGNVSSITDGGVGIFGVNLISALPDTKYSVTTSVGTQVSNYMARTVVINNTNMTTNMVEIRTGYYIDSNSTQVLEDVPLVSVNIFR